MARGWESKSVEEQMADAAETRGAQRQFSSPGRENKPDRAGEAQMSEEERRLAAEKRAATERQRQALHLQRENILSQRTSNANRRAALASALAEIEQLIKALE